MTYPLFPWNATLPVHQIQRAVCSFSWSSHKSLHITINQSIDETLAGSNQSFTRKNGNKAQKSGFRNPGRYPKKQLEKTQEITRQKTHPKFHPVSILVLLITKDFITFKALEKL